MCYNSCIWFNIWSEQCKKPRDKPCPDAWQKCQHCEEYTEVEELEENMELVGKMVCNGCAVTGL